MMEKDGNRLSLIPQWADADNTVLSLPEIDPDWETSPYSVLEALQKLDQVVGYPMAWFFFAVHGKRVGQASAGIVTNAVKDGLLCLPAWDEKVLFRWLNEQY